MSVYEIFRKSFKDLLNECKELKNSDSENYEITEILPVLDDEGFVDYQTSKKQNFKKFMLTNSPSIRNSKSFNEITNCLLKDSLILNYLSGRIIDESGNQITNPLPSQMRETVDDFVNDFLLNYLEMINDFLYDDSLFDDIFKSMRNFLETNHKLLCCFVPIYGLKADCNFIKLDDMVEIRHLPIRHYARIADIDILSDRNFKPDKRYWKLRYALYLRIQSTEKKLPSSEQFFELARVTLDTLRLLKTGSIHLGALYPYFPDTWIWRSLPPRVGVENPQIESSTKLQLTSAEIADLIKIYSWLSKISVKDESKRYILIALRRFNASYDDKYIEDKITNLTIALEVLLTSGPGELQAKLSLRGALLLGRNEHEREYLWQFLKKCYDVRSEIVHGKKRKKIKISEREFTDDDLLVKLEDVARKALVKIIKLQDTIKSQDELISKLDESIVNRNKIIPDGYYQLDNYSENEEKDLHNL